MQEYDANFNVAVPSSGRKKPKFDIFFGAKTDVGVKARARPSHVDGKKSSRAPSLPTEYGIITFGRFLLIARAVVFRHPTSTPCAANGSLRIGRPLNAAMAFATAGAIGGVPGSPTPVGSFVDGTIYTSTAGICRIRNTL